MFATLAALVPRDGDLPERAWKLDVLRRVLQGTIYDKLTSAFHEERNGAGEYIPLRARRPSTRWNLCRIATMDSVALLFGEGRFPVVYDDDPDARNHLADVVADSNLPAVMIDASTRGSIGSVAVRFRVLNGRVFFDAFDTLYLTPKWRTDAPDTLAAVTERYKIKGADLFASGYAIPADMMTADYWFQRTWDDQWETWFAPLALADAKNGTVFAKDAKRSVRHRLGFCPWVWIRNLPGGDDIDGLCTFRQGVDTQIELEYLLSQSGRGLKYSADPLLMLKEPAQSDGQLMVRSASNALVISEGGDAKMLEISGSAASAVIEHARVLRHSIMEVIGGSRGDPDKMTAAQSGRAMELLHQPLIWLADKLRGSYGGAVLSLARMMVAASQRYPLRTRDQHIGRIAPVSLSLRWPPWFDPTATDDVAQMTQLTGLVAAGVISLETATALVARECGIANIGVERERIQAERTGTKPVTTPAVRLVTQATEQEPDEPDN